MLYPFVGKHDDLEGVSTYWPYIVDSTCCNWSLAERFYFYIAHFENDTDVM